MTFPQIPIGIKTGKNPRFIQSAAKENAKESNSATWTKNENLVTVYLIDAFRHSPILYVRKADASAVRFSSGSCCACVKPEGAAVAFPVADTSSGVDFSMTVRVVLLCDRCWVSFYQRKQPSCVQKKLFSQFPFAVLGNSSGVLPSSWTLKRVERLRTATGDACLDAKILQVPTKTKKQNDYLLFLHVSFNAIGSSKAKGKERRERETEE